ncbi:MAG TPA: TonB-dependent receptor [Flavobacteriia bacterium]|nr:TonB-dependent receptor [Flavobacteriia bacterium]
MKIRIVFFFITVVAYAQNDTIHLLDEVKLYGNFSPAINSGYQVQILTDSTINSRQQSLGTLLQNKANLYFKQNGFGMVSSISLRGSGASHTGVYWNGIAINSSLNGQTDFSTFSANSYNRIEIRKGGGSILFGSGAIGGAINISDQIIFTRKKETQINLALASYNTQKTLVSSQYGNQSFYAKMVVEGKRSDNDYPYLGTELVNENGNYQNYHIKAVLGYVINSNNQLHLFATHSNNDRNLSRTLTASSRSKLKNKENRLLLDWKNFGASYNSSLKLAYLNEEYNFFFNKASSDFSFGKSNNFIVKYNYTYFFNNTLSIHSGVENTYSTANGTNLKNEDRNNVEAYLLVHQKPLKQLRYNISLRKGFSSVYEIPFIYAADLKYSVSPQVDINANFSTNYRLPTYNDLFWNPGGNPDLLAEDSTTGEIGFGYHSKKITLSLGAYSTKSNNLIQWRPVTGTFWRPVNVQDVSSYGVEFDMGIQHQIGIHQLSLQATYAYTVSKDNTLDKQLIYVPFHKSNAILTYQHKGLTINFNEQYTGKAFTTTSNTQSVAAFWLSNIEIYKTVLKQQLTVGLSVNNLWNTAYESIAFRPMPNRNFELNINYKF